MRVDRDDDWRKRHQPRTRREIAVTRKLALFATTAVMATVPQIAHASCSGNACSAYSAVATWSSSDKHVNTVLTNKDQTNAVHLKFCITVEGRCNSFDLTLPPHGTMTKSVSVSGGAAPPKFAVDVSTADFPPVKPASQGSAAVNAVESPFGKLTYLTTHNDGPMLSKAVADFVQGRRPVQGIGASGRSNSTTRTRKSAPSRISRRKSARPCAQTRCCRLEAGYAIGAAGGTRVWRRPSGLVGELAGHAARDSRSPRRSSRRRATGRRPTS